MTRLTLSIALLLLAPAACESSSDGGSGTGTGSSSGTDTESTGAGSTETTATGTGSTETTAGDSSSGSIEPSTCIELGCRSTCPGPNGESDYACNASFECVPEQELGEAECASGCAGPCNAPCISGGAGAPGFCSATGTCSGDPAECPFDGCEGLACGESCTLCPPDEPDCIEPELSLVCNSQGGCVDPEDHSPMCERCDGACGDPCEVNGVVGECGLDGVCNLDSPAECR